MSLGGGHNYEPQLITSLHHTQKRQVTNSAKGDNLVASICIITILTSEI